MPVLSAFTPCGALACSSAPSHIETFYKLLPTLWGSEIDFSIGTPYDEPKLYAVARMLGLMLYELEHAGNQAYPARVTDLLPLLELDFGIIPGATDTATMRRAVLAAAELLPRGEVASNVTNALRALLGSAFLSYVPGPDAASVSVGNLPSHAGFADVRVPMRLLQLVDAVPTPGAVVFVAYKNFDTTIATPELLMPGDIAIVDAGNTAVMEAVTVAQVFSTQRVNTTAGFNYFEGSFTNPHAAGAPIVVGNFPYWWSTTRLSYIVASAASATNVVLRAKVDALCAKLLRAVEQWAIVEPASTTPTGGTVGPLTVGAAMGVSPVAAINFTNSL